MGGGVGILKEKYTLSVSEMGVIYIMETDMYYYCSLSFETNVQQNVAFPDKILSFFVFYYMQGCSEYWYCWVNIIAYYNSQAQIISWSPRYLISGDSVTDYEVGEKSTKLKKRKI